MKNAFAMNCTFGTCGFSDRLDLRSAYKELQLDCGYRLDVEVQDSVVVELKSAEHILAISPSSTAYIFTPERKAGWLDHQLQCGSA